MKLSTLTTASLLSAALVLPALAQDADAPAAEGQAHRIVIVQAIEDDGVHVERNMTVEIEGDLVIIDGLEGGVDGADNAVEVRGRVMMLDEDGNVVQMDLDGGEWLIEDGDGTMTIEMRELGLPQLLIERMGEAGDFRMLMPAMGARDAMGHGPVNPPMVEATYLGVNCEPLDFDAAALLLIDEGTGLDVGFVAEDSPALAAGIAVGDVLVSFNDQILINPQQLAVLIRTQEAGDTISLGVIRAGEAFDIEVELGTNTVPQLGPGGQNLDQFWHVDPHMEGQQFELAPMQLQWRRGGPDAETFQALINRLQDQEGLEGIELDLEELHEHLQQMQEGLMDNQVELQELLQNLNQQQGNLNQQHRFQLRLNNQDAAQTKIVWNDGEHTLTVTSDGEAGQTLNVTDTQGEVLFDGPMPEGDAIDDLPDAFRDKVIELQDVASNGIGEDE